MKEHHPHVNILARAIDRSHLYELKNLGVTEVVRDTFYSSLEMGTQALRLLGFRAFQARRSAQIFKAHDLKVIEDLHPLWGDRKNYIVKTRQSREDLENILQSEQTEYSEDEEKAWDTASMLEEFGAINKLPHRKQRCMARHSEGRNPVKTYRSGPRL
jgi:hypothetical protein